MAFFTLTLVRHGETLENKHGIMQGQQNTALSEKGVRQAMLLGLRLQNEHYTQVYTSDLQRALKTCEYIMNSNKCTKSEVFEDPRLRERMFGCMEGKHRSEFISARKKSMKSWEHYTPPGGESNEEVKQRVVRFFQHLCKQMLKPIEQSGNGNEQSARKRRYSSTEVFHMYPTDSVDLPVGGSSEQSRQEDLHNVVDFQNNGAINVTETSNGLNVLGTNSIHVGSMSGSVLSQEHKYGYEQNVKSNDREHINHEEEYQSEDKIVNTASNQSVQTNPGLQHYNSSSSSSNTCSSNANSSVSNSISFAPSVPIAVPQSSGASHDGPPNVSLSPAQEHRLSFCSVISSGRNNSFDDGDVSPTVLGDVLVVSHGGVLRQLTLYFMEDLGCTMPVCRQYVLRATPNASLSKFTISLGLEGEKPVVTCLSINDQDHLLSLEQLAKRSGPLVMNANSAAEPFVDATPLKTTKYDL